MTGERALPQLASQLNAVEHVTFFNQRATGHSKAAIEDARDSRDMFCALARRRRDQGR